MGFTRWEAGQEGVGFSQCDDCGLTFTTSTRCEGDRTFESVEKEHGEICSGPSTDARAKKLAAERAAEDRGSGIASGSIRDVIDLEKYVEEQIEALGDERGRELARKTVQEIRKGTADLFNDNLDVVMTWRLGSKRGSHLLGRWRKKPTRREQEIYMAGATDLVAFVMQEMYWRAEDLT